MRIKITYLLFFLLNLTFSLKSQQEVVTDLDYIYEIVTNPESQNLKSVNLSDTLATPVNMPFIDDFSNPSVHPDINKWKSNGVHINNCFAMNSPTLGVATFDAFDETGKLKEGLLFDVNYQGDELTSSPIIMNESDINVYLSFLYQPGGFSAAPHNDDSLVLQFYSRDSAQWKTVWKALNNTKDSLVKEIYIDDTLIWRPKKEIILSTKDKDTSYTVLIGSQANFKNVLLPINRLLYADSSFRFRFINFFSVAEDTYKGYTGNYTKWHIDYVKVAANRNINDTIINDISFVGRIDSILMNYTSIPAKHLKTNLGPNEKNFKPRVTIKNNNDSIVNFNRSIIIRDEIRKIEVKQDSEGDTIRKFGLLHLADEFEPDLITITSNITDLGIYKYIYKITPTELTSNVDEIPQNDSITQLLELSDYYSYDDGSPEKGYGLTGQNTHNAKVAVGFEPYLSDTLHGIHIYFNRPFKNDHIFFKLTVWNKRGNSPGDTLYSREVTTLFEEGLYKPKYYKLDSPLIINGPFYIGWIQMKEEYLNVGLDTYTDCDKKYVNFGSGWAQSKIKGSLMIRPVFGKRNEPVGIFPVKKELDFIVYPNPVNEELFIEGLSGNIRFSITDIQGRMMKNGIIENNRINCSDLKKGIYIFSIEMNGIVKHKKIVVAGNY